MSKSTITAIALAFGLSCGAGAMAQTINMEGTSIDHPNTHQHHSIEAYTKARGDVAVDYRADVTHCRSLYGEAARAQCRADARAERAAARATLRNDVYVDRWTYPRYFEYDYVDQGMTR